MNTYWWLCFRALSDEAELDQVRLFELGATGTEEVEENPGSARAGVLIKGFFEDQEAFAAALRAFRGKPELASGDAPVEDWDRSWRDRQTAVEVTPFLTVAPPWVRVEASETRHVVRLEAKMAFGTGSHETTRIAASLLERSEPAGKSALDIGTGTGLLGLYAALLGARHVVAFDIDPVVAANLSENLILNPPPEGCRFHGFIGELSALAPVARFDLILCNMIRTELWPFKEALHGLLNPGGTFVVSGQRLEDKAYFLAWQAAAPFGILEEMTLEGWWGFRARTA